MGRRPKISRADAARTALELVDDEGLDALSVAAVARRLGMRAPSLYNHFADRADLMQSVGRAVLRDAGDLPAVAEQLDWRELLAQRALLVRRAILAHPNAAPLLVDPSPRYALTPVYEYWTAMLDANHVPEKSWLEIIQGLEGLTYGSALSAAAATRSGRQPFPELDPAEYPTLSRAVSAEHRSPEAVFLSTVHRFLAQVD
jgi:AcrR family transcriptional regulator